MARVKGICRIEGCDHPTYSLGNRGGKPYYAAICGKHRKLFRKERKEKQS